MLLLKNVSQITPLMHIVILTQVVQPNVPLVAVVILALTLSDHLHIPVALQPELVMSLKHVQAQALVVPAIPFYLLQISVALQPELVMSLKHVQAQALVVPAIL